MDSASLQDRLTSSNIDLHAIDLRDLIAPGEVWDLTEGWQPLELDTLPKVSLITANLSETIDGQTSVTVTSAWSLEGRFDPVDLLTGFTDPAPADTEVVSMRQEEPRAMWYGAATTGHTVYRFGEPTLTGITRFDVLVDPSSAESTGGVLLQRTYNSPMPGTGPRLRALPDSIVSALLDQRGR